MALQKQSLPINFSLGLDLKTDPFQVAPGNFLALENSVFSKTGLLQKRNGYRQLASLPNANSSLISTLNDNLVAIGDGSIQAYSGPSNTWINKGSFTPVSVDAVAALRNNLNQTYADVAVSDSGLLCLVYAETDGSTTTYKYSVIDAATGQNIVNPTAINALGTATYTPRVFTVGRYFLIVFNDVITGVNTLSYQQIQITNPSVVYTPVSISTAYTSAANGSFDGTLVDGSLYLAWNANTGGGAIKMCRISAQLVQSSTITVAGITATNVSVCGDSANIYVSSFDTATNIVKTFARDKNNLAAVLAPTTVSMGSDDPINITSVASNGTCTVICEAINAYSYDPTLYSDYVIYNTITSGGTVGTAQVSVRSLGLASDAFVYNGNTYYLGVYGGPQGQTSYQPGYYLMSLDGHVIAKLAYQNGGVYYRTGLSGVVVQDNAVIVPYLYKSLIQAVNKNTNVPTGSQTAGIYSQTGVNVATIEFTTDRTTTAEIGGNLQISGGFLANYDGYSLVENNFFVYPENIKATWSATGGSIAAKPDSSTNTNAYFYQVTYEWTDNNGNPSRSAPSIPLAVTTSGSGTSGSITLNIPTLRLTYKTDNPVKIVIYRWSLGQQSYYQVTSITSPLLNDPTVDSVTYVDTQADSSILGNNLIYTTGGVIENISPPACDVIALYQSRLMLIEAENKNNLWYSKQVIQSTSVEMNDGFVMYVAPTTAAQGATGPVRGLCPLDDKLILFKKDALYYINGAGPDNAGLNNQLSEPTFISSTIGSDQPKSIVFTPVGLMFQSDKGIWTLGRDLSTSYTGAPVEAYNANVALSSVNVPGTNQVRFTIDAGSTLMYDYYFQQWGTFTGIPGISSTLYQGLHTFIDSYGRVFQESPDKYLDGNRPVELKFTTGWMNLAGLQGLERAYFFYILATYKSPHRLQIQIAYDFERSPSQTVEIVPDNYATPWGDSESWGSTPYWGGNSTVEQWRVFLNKQKVQSFQISVREVYDPSLGAPAGAGLTISGLNLVVGLKKGYATLKPSKSVG